MRRVEPSPGTPSRAFSKAQIQPNKNNNNAVKASETSKDAIQPHRLL